MNKVRLKWKIFAFLLGFCALLLAILWLFQTVLLDDFYQRIRMAEIRRDAAVIAANVNTVTGKNIAEIIEDMSEEGGINVDIVDANGRSRFRAAHNTRDTWAEQENTALMARAREAGGEFYERASPPPARSGWNDSPARRPVMQSLVYARLDADENGEVFAVIIRAIVSPVNATVTTLRYQLYFISGIMLLLAVVLAIIIAKRVSKPIEEISHSAMNLAKGRYDTRFTGKGFYEIKALSDTLNIAAAELGQVEALRRELLANVSHDLRTPLALIYSYAEMMHDFPEEVTPEQTQTIMNETRRLTTLVNDVLDISKMENDLESLALSPINLTWCVLETTERMEELLKKENFVISFTCGGDAFVRADRTKIERAFYNLLINAVNYSGESRAIAVAQTIVNGYVRISITDSGEGIAVDELPFIWDRYYKSGKAHKRAVMGTGLGLSIVKKIIESHGGRYGVESVLGQGSTFWFELAL